MEVSKRILLVEDNSNDIELVLIALSEYGLDKETFVVRDGVEALDYIYRRNNYKELSGFNPTVILLDLKLPKIDGLEVLKHIKTDNEYKNIPVVIFSSSRQEDDMVKSYDSGANAYTVKPVAFQEFVETVKNIGKFWIFINEPPVGSLEKPVDFA